jgi:hypothetical protein
MLGNAEMRALQNVRTGNSFELARKSGRSHSLLTTNPDGERILVSQNLTTDFNNGINALFLLIHYCQSSARQATHVVKAVDYLDVTERPTRGSLLQLVQLLTTCWHTNPAVLTSQPQEVVTELKSQ